MPYSSRPVPPPAAGFRLQVTRLGWWMMGSYAVLWLALFALTSWLPEGTLSPVAVPPASDAVRVVVEANGSRQFTNLATRDLVLQRGRETVAVLLPGETLGVEDGLADRDPVVARYLLEQHEVWRSLRLQPLSRLGASGDYRGDGIGPAFWQWLTGPLFYPPKADVIDRFLLVHPAGFPSLMMGFLGFIFFAAPVEQLLGRRRFLELWVVSSLGAVLLGLGIGALVGAAPHYGFAPAVLAVMVVHCMMTPEASVQFHLIFTVVHLRMKWIAAAIAGFVLLRSLGLMGVQPGGYELAGIATGYFWWRKGGDFNLRRMLLRRRGRKNLRLAVDRALAGDDDGPVFH
ncbi:MAG: rhomboid family intramembrane serine protease [Myxococcota bacterium]|nr:rhomboid family intramembrane serine protease [Myxococcota bacterium]